MDVAEEAFVFNCDGSHLLGILHRPEVPSERGVVIVVGGPQYRVGSHRQFLLLARDLAKRGIPVFRFDYRGMGDSDGPSVTFEDISPDIEAAVNVFLQNVPELNNIVIWGLCDAASAAMIYAHSDKRIWGIVLVNPWVRSDTGIAKTHLRYYYVKRFLAVAFWKQLLSGQIDISRSALDLIGTIRKALSSKTALEPRTENSNLNSLPFITRMLIGFERFHGRVLFIISGEDYTAAEFSQLVTESRRWSKLVRRATVQWRELRDANHTFSREEWRNTVAAWTDEWIRS